MIHSLNALFMFDFHFGHLPIVFDGFFKKYIHWCKNVELY